MPPTKPPKRPAVRPPKGATPKPIARPPGATKTTPPHISVATPPARADTARVPAAPTTDSTAAQRAEALIARLFELDTAIKSDFYEIGVVLRDLNREGMYRPLGFKSFSELLRTRALPKRAMAYRLIDVVDHLDKPTAHRLGVERAYHAIKYAQQKAPTVSVPQFIRKNPTFHFQGIRYQLHTAPTRVLAHLVAHLASGAPEKPPASLAPTARSLGQIFHHLGFEGARVTSHRRGHDAYLTIRLPLADAQKLRKHLT